MKNKYAKRARISEAKIHEIVRYVAADLTALQAAALSGLNRNTVNRLYRGVRERMLLACEAQRRLFGVVEVDESFFGARRVKAGGGAAPTARPSSSASSSGRATAIPRSSRTAQSPPSRASSAVGSTRAPSSTPMAGAATTAWSTSAMATSASTMPATSSPKAHRPYQRHRRLLGPSQGPADPIQGPAETHLPPPSQGDRMAIQPSPRRQVQMPATVPT